jgi:hypothetical protein
MLCIHIPGPIGAVSRSYDPTMKTRALRPVAVLLGIASAMLTPAAQADNFANVYYDASKDQLVVTMAYRGTNRHHKFSLQWGPCNAPQDGNLNEVTADVLDSQWQDAAVSDFKKTTRFSLAGIPCRPAKVTLRTAPRFLATVVIPAGPSQLP